MAPSSTSPKTYPRVLPQLGALESVSADNPRGRDETGRGAPASGRGTGARHGRGETAEPGTTVRRRHPDVPAQAGAEGAPGHTAHPHVFVIDKHGRPLQPCHPARARQLLQAGRAVVARHTPFVIRIKDRAAGTSVVPGVEVGIDPGSKTTGIAVFTAVAADSERPDPSRRGLFAVELAHRGGQIHRRMHQRAAYRRRRRSANLRYRQPRFRNRRRPDGWLPPSLRHRVDTTMSRMNRLSCWAPVRAVHVERVAFDTQLLQNPEISGAEYQQGTLAGYELREYMLEKWDRQCAYCDETDAPLNLDHIHPRSRGGSNRASNRTLACVPCNQAKGDRPIEEFLARRPDRLRRILAQAKAPLHDAAAVNATRWALWRALTATGLLVHAASGGRTKWNRTRCDLPKTHTLDALCVGRMDTIVRVPAKMLMVAATGRGSYQRTRTDKFGFPRLRLPQVKQIHGFATGDLVRAVVPAGKHTGTYVGRVAVRVSGKFNIRTRSGLVQGIHHRHVRLLQHADGYGYT